MAMGGNLPAGETMKQWLDREMLMSANVGLEDILAMRKFPSASVEHQFLTQDLARERFIGSCYLRIHEIYQRACNKAFK